MNEVMNVLQEVLLNVLLALISLAGTYAIIYINKCKKKVMAETERINDQALEDLIKNSINQLDKLIKTTVYSIEQEIASEIRKKIESGDTSVSREDLVALKDKAYKIIKSTVNPNVVEYATEVITDVDQYILDKISEEVKILKDSQNASDAS